MNEYKFSEIELGMTESFTKEVTKEMEEMFRAISGDSNPMHFDDAFARRMNPAYQSHISFGMLTASLYSTLSGVYLPGKYSLLHSMEELSFMKPVYLGDQLTVTGEVVDIIQPVRMIQIKAVITNQNGEKVSRAKMKVCVLDEKMVF